MMLDKLFYVAMIILDALLGGYSVEVVEDLDDLLLQPV
jgi:hypothetical protein